MKKYIHIAAALLLGYSAVSCRDESLLSFGGEGKMTLSTSIKTDIRVVSRALEDGQNNELATKTLVWITNSDNELLYRYEGVVNQPEELTLSSGIYYADAWVGDSIPAFGSWEEGKGKRYHTREEFEIVSGQTTPVKLVCGVRNTLVTPKIDANTSRVLKNISFEVALNDPITDGSHSVTFAGDNLNGTGYFMLNSKTEGFRWTLSGTDVDGKEFSASGEYKDPEVESAPYLAHATEYIFNVKYNSTQGDIEIGGVYLDIDVEPEPVEGTVEETLIALPPEFSGFDGFDISRPVLASPGTVGRKSIHVIASSTLTRIDVEGSLIDHIFERDNGFDVMAIAEPNNSNRQFLEEKGINFILHDNHPGATEDNFRPTNMRLNLEEVLTNNLPLGEYDLTIHAYDENGNDSEKTITFNISEAPGQLNEINEDNPNISYTSARLTADITKPGDKMGIEIKADGAASRASEDWTFVKGELNGTTLSVNLDNLKDGTKYLYRLVIDDYISPEMSFSTPAYPQLENNGFEDWYNGGVTPSNNSKGWFPIVGPNNIFWDCGNHGSLTLGGNITNRSSDVKHSGSYSIEMKSQFVGLVVAGKFAAGNVFYGKYLKTDGTDGELGFGRPFPNIRPKAVKGWVKYRPTAIDNKYEYNALPEGAELKQGDLDQGIIYVALLSDNLNIQGDGSTYPVLIKTKKQSDGKPKLFNSTASNVVAYGEKIFNETSGEEMVEFTINLNDVHAEETVAYIMVVCSASRYGDYFAGGRGSTMWVDDLELVY